MYKVDKSVECMQWNGMGRDGKTKQGDRDLGRHLFIQALIYLTLPHCAFKDIVERR